MADREETGLGGTRQAQPASEDTLAWPKEGLPRGSQLSQGRGLAQVSKEGLKFRVQLRESTCPRPQEGLGTEPRPRTSLPPPRGAPQAMLQAGVWGLGLGTGSGPPAPAPPGAPSQQVTAPQPGCVRLRCSFLAGTELTGGSQGDSGLATSPSWTSVLDRHCSECLALPLPCAGVGPWSLGPTGP